jgi:signal transduction histidine kinase
MTRPLPAQLEDISIREFLASLAERANALTDSVVASVRGGDFVLAADSALLARAFENILRNAAEAIGQRGGGGGEISIDVDAAGPRVVITDNGIGIDEADSSKLLLPFQSRKPNGFGLGLFLARKILLVHGATLRLSPRPDGPGAVATIEFAAAGPAAEVRSGS